MKWIAAALLLFSAGAFGQSERECRDGEGRVWIQAGACPAGTPPVPTVLRKCVDAKGHVTYQNAPCDAAARETGASSYTVRDQAYGRMADERRQQSSQVQQQRQQQVRARSSVATGARIPVENTTNMARCDAAKAERKRQLDAVGIHRNYDFLSRLDAMVREACK